jgi:DNA-binding MarR family transcriptional regulator
MFRDTNEDTGERVVGRDSNTKQALSEAEARTLLVGLHFLDALREARSTMPLQHAYAFLVVAMDEGKGVKEYAETTGIAQTSMTRHLLDLGPKTRNNEPGLGLLMQRQDPLDMRKHQTFLTSEGRALAHKLIRALK